jgi:hypothetical protein
MPEQHAHVDRSPHVQDFFVGLLLSSSPADVPRSVLAQETAPSLFFLSSTIFATSIRVFSVLKPTQWPVHSVVQRQRCVRLSLFAV